MLKTLIRQIDEKFKELGLSYSAVEKNWVLETVQSNDFQPVLRQLKK